MCFAPQRRALFRHINFKKCSDPGVLRTFWLGNVLRATTACNFLSLIWPDYFSTTRSHKSLLPFRAPVFFLLTLSLILSLLLFSLLTLPTSAFPSVHIVGSLTSKLPDDYFPTQSVFGALVRPIFGQIQSPKDKTLSSIRHGWWSFTTLWPLLQLPFLFQVATALRL